MGELPVGLVVLYAVQCYRELACQCLSCPAHGESLDTAVGCVFYPSSSVDDAQWAVLEPLLPPPGNTTGKGGRPEKHPRRIVLDAIFYVIRGGIAWRQLPRDFPPAMTVYDVCRRWAAAGVWQRVHDCLRDLVRLHAGRGVLPTAAILDVPRAMSKAALLVLESPIRESRTISYGGTELCRESLSLPAGAPRASRPQGAPR